MPSGRTRGAAACRRRARARADARAGRGVPRRRATSARSPRRAAGGRVPRSPRRRPRGSPAPARVRGTPRRRDPTSRGTLEGRFGNPRARAGPGYVAAMASDDAIPPLTDAQRSARSSSFGSIAEHYERYRPGPSVDVAAWFVPEPVERVVDLGAGTGALARLRAGPARDVVAVEPDDRMRAVLQSEVAGVRALPGRGEAIPVADG